MTTPVSSQLRTPGSAARNNVSGRGIRRGRPLTRESLRLSYRFLLCRVLREVRGNAVATQLRTIGVK
jgi:hypothetical protein